MTQINTTILGFKKMDNSLARTVAMQQYFQQKTPLILESLDNPSITIENSNTDLSSPTNNVPNATDLESLNMHVDEPSPESPSLLLLDEHERIRVSSPEQFLKYLKIHAEDKVKVISIFGNTGEGKSHTLNHAFFNGQEMFKTSPEQISCTMGAWAAYDPNMNVICIDTEGLLGVTKKESQRTRMLLKVLAISDIVIYRTRSERLQRDLYTFLGGASRAYTDHFQLALKQILKKAEMENSTSSLGPSVIIFHETRHTNTLQMSASVTESPEDIIRRQFSELKLDYDAFSSIKYIGVQTKDKPTSFGELKNAIQLHLENTTVRSRRNPKVIYKTLKVLAQSVRE